MEVEESVEVEESEVTAIIDGLGPIRGQRVLEVGCGSGSNLRMVLDRGALVWGVDTSARRLRVAHSLLPDADLRVGSIGDLPFDSLMFDAVYALGLSGKIDHTARTVAELARVCRVGGVVAISLADKATADGVPRTADLARLASRAGLWPVPSPASAVISIKVCSQQ